MIPADPSIAWFIAGLILVLLEFVAPGVILIFIGLGAWIASLTTWLDLTPTLGSQTAVFAIGSLTLLLGLRRSCKEWFLGSSQKGDATSASEEFLQREVRVLTPIQPEHSGKVEFKGAQWNARSQESLHPGDTAIITARDGLHLTVRRR